MLRRRLNYLNFTMRLVTLMLPSMAFGIAGYLRFVSGLIPPHWEINPADYFGLLFFTTLVWSLAVEHYGLTRADLVFAASHPARKALEACVVTYVTVTASSFFYRGVSFSRVFIALSAVTLFLLVVLVQRGFRALLVRTRQKENARARVLIVGADEVAERFARTVLERVVMPCSVAGFVRLPGQEVTVAGSPVMELNIAEITRVCPEIDEIILAFPPGRYGEILTILGRLEPLCRPVRAVLDLGRGVVLRDALFDFEGVPMVDLRVTPSESVMYLIAKRGFDLVFSTVALIVCAPLMALIALAIRLTSGSPVFFAQDRVGLNGRVFQMYKFRTMRTGDRAESDTTRATPGDPRRTELGAFLRRTNLDELPQFFNVLKGEMSVVGPRPEMTHFVQKLIPEVAQYNTRHYLKVGMTGWAQVNGWRGDTSIARRVEHDLYYLENWSLLFDLKIIFLTIWRSLVANRNAY